jgi:hypothetical protein
MKIGLKLLATTGGAVLSLVAPFGMGAAQATASATPTVVVVSATPTNGLPPAVVSAPGDPQSFQFATAVPAGGSLISTSPAKSGAEFSTEVMVKDAAGKAVGAYDAPYAIDANGALLHASYRIEGTNLVETLKTDASTAFPVSVLFSDYAPVTDGAGTGVHILLSKVTVPSNYVYDPSRGSLHDYCTSSPDSYLSADFRGPCARHDLCYEAPGNHKSSCDNTLHNNLVNNCDYAYGSLNPVRYTCRTVAGEYWAAVTAFGDDN